VTAFAAWFGGRRRLGRHWCRGHGSREEGPLRRRRGRRRLAFRTCCASIPLAFALLPRLVFVFFRVTPWLAFLRVFSLTSDFLWKLWIVQTVQTDANVGSFSTLPS